MKKFLFIFVAIIVFPACATIYGENNNSGQCSRFIAALGIKSPAQLEKYFMYKNPDGDRALVHRLAEYYYTESRMEGINSDVAWAQMCLETGFLKYGLLVTPEMHNYCGLGAVDKKTPPATFSTEALGVRAHIQHLHAYGTTSDCLLINRVIDPRYTYVQPRGKADTIYKLTSTWAKNKNYANFIDRILTEMEKY